jgi:hypothetical protein
MQRQDIRSPKRQRRKPKTKEAWFDYYAGFSVDFVSDTIRAMGLPRSALIFDPWNGSGTTTTTAHEMGYSSIGIDINPSMVVVARSKLLSKGLAKSLMPLAYDLVEKAAQMNIPQPVDDPLVTWFAPGAAKSIRALADSITTVLTKCGDSTSLYTPSGLDQVSDLTAFYLVALFRTVRSMLGCFQASNPTWMKTPDQPQNRLRPSAQKIQQSFKDNVASMVLGLTSQELKTTATIQLGNSCSLPSAFPSVDTVICSPPYCTRIDYAVATKPELALLGCPMDTEFLELRRSLTGGTVINTKKVEICNSWGSSCLSFLEKVSDHPSKGSKSYYLKLFLKYFSDIYLSLNEIKRVLAKKGQIVLVIQDSYYKSEHIDIARFITEMAMNINCTLVERLDFETNSLMAHMNPRSRQYRNRNSAIESVLWLRAV